MRQPADEPWIAKQIVSVGASLSPIEIRFRKFVEFSAAIIAGGGHVDHLGIKLFRQLAFRAIEIGEDLVSAREQKIVFTVDAIIEAFFIQTVPQICGSS